ncbi:15653_t:CDS:2 [Entrophospora sp. SA101]|nr:15653_t:CDS:2 [Entrophospora sp. SA101]
MTLSIGETTSTTLQQPLRQPSQRSRKRISSSGSIYRNSQRPISMVSQSSLPSSNKRNSLNQPVPEFPPPPYTPPESSQTRYRRPSTNFFIKPKTSQELRKEIQKLREDRKKEQETWKAEERRLKIKVGAKPEDIDRVKRKLNEKTMLEDSLSVVSYL